MPIFENDEFKNWGLGFELFSRRRSSLVRTDGKPSNQFNRSKKAVELPFEVVN